MSFLFQIVRINSASAALAGVKNPSFDRREVQLPAGADGTIHQTSAPVIRTAPRASFSILSLKTLFAAMTTTQVPYIALDGTNGWEGIALKVGAVPGYDSGSTHISRKMARGMLLLDGVTWSPGQAAEAACSVFGLSADGTTDPVASDAIALPTIPTLQEQCALAALTLNSVALTKIQNLSVQIAHQVENSADVCYVAGLPYPTMLTMPGLAGPTEITASIDTRDFDAVIGNGALVITFKVANHNGIGLSASTATITLATSVMRETQIDRETRRIEVRATWNGSTNPIAIATA